MANPTVSPMPAMTPLQLVTNNTLTAPEQTRLEFCEERNGVKPKILEEYEHKIMLAKMVGGAVEVQTPVGLIDVLSDTCVWEVKQYKKWKSALGQVLAYGYFYPSRGKGVYLYGIPGEKVKEKITIICAFYSVGANFADPSDCGFSKEEASCLLSKVREIAITKSKNRGA